MPASLTEARYYDPQTGRFLQEDPEQPGQVRVQGGRAVVIKPRGTAFQALELNPYAYVRNNPVNFTDPYGLLRRGSKEWNKAKKGAAATIRGGVEEAQAQGLQCPVISGKSSDESIEAVAEAFADEAKDEEFGPFGVGLLNKQTQERIDKGLREKHPDWPWAGWDEVKKSVEELKKDAE